MLATHVSSPYSGPSRWLFPPALFVVAALQFTDNSMMPLIKLLLEKELWPEEWVGGLFVAYALGAAIVPITLTSVRRAPAPSRESIVALLFLALSAAGIASGVSFHVALLLRFGAGAASGVLSYALLVLAVAHGRTAVASLTAGFLVGLVIGVPGAAQLVSVFGLPAFFATLSVAFVALAGALVAFGSTTVVSSSERTRLRDFFRSKRHRSALVATLLIATAIAGPMTLLPDALQASDQAGLRLSEVAKVYYLAGIGPLLAMPIAILLQKPGRTRSIARMGALLLAPTLLLMSRSLGTFWTAAFALFVALLIETVRRTALQQHMALMTSPVDRSRYLALRGLLVQLGVAGGTALCQWGGTPYQSAAFLGGAVLALISAGFVPPLEDLSEAEGAAATA